MSDGAEIELVHDFRAIYGLSWWRQVETGDVYETAHLLAGLHLRSDSLWRATSFTARPPQAGSASRSLGWLGWDQQTALLLDIRNLLSQKGRLQPPPSAAEDIPPTTEIDSLKQLRMPR